MNCVEVTLLLIEGEAVYSWPCWGPWMVTLMWKSHLDSHVAQCLPAACERRCGAAPMGAQLWGLAADVAAQTCCDRRLGFRKLPGSCQVAA
jgi:hypothetical protein